MRWCGEGTLAVKKGMGMLGWPGASLPGAQWCCMDTLCGGKKEKEHFQGYV